MVKGIKGDQGGSFSVTLGWSGSFSREIKQVRVIEVLILFGRHSRLISLTVYISCKGFCFVRLTG